MHRMLHAQDIGELSPYYDTARKSKAKTCDFRRELFFLKLKPFFFSLLCTVHINLAYQNVIQLPSVKYNRFYISKIQFYVKCMLYKMMPIVT